MIISWSIFTINHLPTKSITFTILPVNLKAGKSSTLIHTKVEAGHFETEQNDKQCWAQRR